MDLEFLKEYEADEFQKHTQSKALLNRFKDLKQPLFNLSTPCPSFWSQLPFSGTLVVPLSPQPEKMFEEEYKISVKEIPDLIKFAKETNKIQFVLCGEDITNFSNCDYLEPLFEELHPPLYLTDMSFDNEENRKIFQESLIELTTLFDLSPMFSRIGTLPNGTYMISEYIVQYSNLRYFGFNDIADTFLENILINPEYASIYLETAYEIMIHPLIDPLKANLSLYADTIQRAQKMGLVSRSNNIKSDFPEIGSFLLKKTTHYPESLTACKDLISRYDENDLYTVYSSLNAAVSECNTTAIIDSKDELEVILQNVWEDIGIIKQNNETYKYGIAITVGVVGYSINPLCGLLGSIGVSALTQTKSSFLDNYAELISKKIAKPYIANIYDFQKKYNLPA